VLGSPVKCRESSSSQPTHRKGCEDAFRDHNVWKYDFGGNSNVVETYVSYLRKKLDVVGPTLIRTVRQVGYMLDFDRG
jgi:DNA-binding response OmpR family regulator